MSWGRNDDNMLEHLKWKMLEDDARLWADALALWSAARDYANRASTDGYIPEVCLRSLTPMDRKRAKAVAEALVNARPHGHEHGLWERSSGGYQIHDFLVYNESRASKAAKAEQDRANAEHAEAHRNAERKADAERKRSKRAGVSGGCPPDSPPDTTPDNDRTPRGQSAGHDTGQAPDRPADASRPRAHAQAPAQARAHVHARGPGPTRPVPCEEGSTLRERVWSSWSSAFTKHRGAFPSRDDTGCGEIARLLALNAPIAGSDADALLGEVMAAYWSQDWPRQHANRASIQNLVRQFDGLLAGLRRTAPARGRPFDPSADAPTTPDEERQQREWVAAGCPAVRRTA